MENLEPEPFSDTVHFDIWHCALMDSSWLGKPCLYDVCQEYLERLKPELIWEKNNERVSERRIKNYKRQEKKKLAQWKSERTRERSGRCEEAMSPDERATQSRLQMWGHGSSELRTGCCKHCCQLTWLSYTPLDGWQNWLGFCSVFYFLVCDCWVCWLLQGCNTRWSETFF